MENKINKKSYLIKMVDGGLIDVKSDDWCEAEGCHTCQYGSLFMNEITLVMEGIKAVIILGSSYKYYNYSTSDLMKLLCNSVEKISTMTQEEFVEFVVEDIAIVYKNDDGYSSYKPAYVILNETEPELSKNDEVKILETVNDCLDIGFSYVEEDEYRDDSSVDNQTECSEVILEDLDVLADKILKEKYSLFDRLSKL